MIINFAIVQVAPGGPIDVIIAQIKGTAVDPTQRFTAGQGEQAQTGRDRQQSANRGKAAKYRGAQGIDPALIRRLEKTFGFDKPLHERFFLMMGRYLTFDFGTSFFRDRRVVDLVIDKLPVSISLGLWTDADHLPDLDPARHRQGGARRLALRRLDPRRRSSSATRSRASCSRRLLVVLFAGGSFLQIFPLRGLTSDNFAMLSLVAARPRLCLAYDACRSRRW